MSRTKHHGLKQKLRQFGDKWLWMQNYPKWHDKLYHTKPRRMANKEAIHKATEDLDSDIVYPLDKKPHKYYW